MFAGMAHNLSRKPNWLNGICPCTAMIFSKETENDCEVIFTGVCLTLIWHKSGVHARILISNLILANCKFGV